MTIGAIIAIGGGEICVPQKEPETLGIDVAIVGLTTFLTQKEKPNLLFIPTGAWSKQGGEDDILYCATAYKHFRQRLGCNFESLRIIADCLTTKQIEQKMHWADVVYVGGGNSRKMMQVWRETGTDQILTRGYMEHGLILSGLSAGSICWFKHSISDSERCEGKEDWKPVWVRGLGLIQRDHSPHYDTEPWRKEHLVNRAKKRIKSIVALENNTALVVMNEQFKIISSQPNKQVWRITCNGSSPILQDGTWRDIEEL